MIKQPLATDVGTFEHESGRKKPAVGARRRSKSVGKPKLESSLVKQPFKSSVTIDDDIRDGDLPSRKQSVTNNQVKKFSSLTSSVVMDDGSDLACAMENCIYNTKDRPLRTTSFQSSNIDRPLKTTSFQSSNVERPLRNTSFQSSGVDRPRRTTSFQSSSILHKVASSRLSTAVDTGVNRQFEPKISQYETGDVHSYKLRDDLDYTDEDAMDSITDSEATEDPEENDDDTTDPPTNPEENIGNAEAEVPGNPEDATDELIENEDGERGLPSEDKTQTSDSVESEETTADKLLIKFLLLAFICKAVSLFFHPDKCTC